MYWRYIDQRNNSKYLLLENLKLTVREGYLSNLGRRRNKVNQKVNQ